MPHTDRGDSDDTVGLRIGGTFAILGAALFGLILVNLIRCFEKEKKKEKKWKENNSSGGGGPAVFLPKNVQYTVKVLMSIAAGVFLTTALLQIVPTARESFSEAGLGKLTCVVNEERLHRRGNLTLPNGTVIINVTLFQEHDDDDDYRVEYPFPFADFFTTVALIAFFMFENELEHFGERWQKAKVKEILEKRMVRNSGSSKAKSRKNISHKGENDPDVQPEFNPTTTMAPETKKEEEVEQNNEEEEAQDSTPNQQSRNNTEQKERGKEERGSNQVVDGRQGGYLIDTSVVTYDEKEQKAAAKEEEEEARSLKQMTQEYQNFSALCILEVGLGMHNILLGLGIGIETDAATIRSLIIAVSVDQFLEGIAVGIALLKSNKSLARTLMMMFLYAIWAGLGSAIGLIVERASESTTQSKGWNYTRGFVGAISGGILIHAALLDVLQGLFDWDPFHVKEAEDEEEEDGKEEKQEKKDEEMTKKIDVTTTTSTFVSSQQCCHHEPVEEEKIVVQNGEQEKQQSRDPCKKPARPRREGQEEDASSKILGEAVKKQHLPWWLRVCMYIGMMVGIAIISAVSI